ncbi:Uncharacterised protein [Tsukamurella paurometabola]|uniref:Lumazine-binding domain n=1 Tax=Tsukamurella paurometabola TaxID=2061 RepID=A0A3P8JWY4_TSUPA|nr:Uncharacterised protein [Tsukamurella paurometabola]
MAHPSPLGSYAGPPAGTPFGGFPPQGPPPRPQSFAARYRWWLAGGSIALVAIIAVVTVVAVMTGGSDDTSPKAVVSRYLDALNRGDAATALSLSDPANDKRFLTDSALKAQYQRDKITGVQLSEGMSAGEFTTIAANYNVGDQVVSGSIKVNKRADGWKLEDGVLTVTLGTTTPAVLGLATLFGTKLSEGTTKINVFPGPLYWGTTTNNLQITSDSSVGSTLAPFTPSTRYMTVRTAVTESGAEAARQAVREWAEGCAKSRKWDASDVAGCKQMSYTLGTAGEVTWTAPTDYTKLTITPDALGAAKATVRGDLNWTAGGAGRQESVRQMIYGTVDLSANPAVFVSSF